MKNKLQYLEGVRGLAALIVVFKHLQLTLAPNALQDLKMTLESDMESWVFIHLLLGIVQFFFTAELAVYVFWFLSAYVISIKLFTIENPSYLVSAFSKRYFRLVIPVLVSLLLAYSLMILGTMHNLQLAKITDNEWLTGFYNFVPSIYETVKLGVWGLFFRDDNPIYNPVLWTIYPEFLGSLSCFALYGILGNQKSLIPIVLTMAGIVLLLQKYWLATFLLGFAWCAIHYSKHQNLWRSAATRLFHFQRLNVIIWLMLLVVSGVFEFYFGGLYGHYWLYHVATSSIIIIILTQTVSLQNVFAWRPFVWLGRVSFGLYVVHFPIIYSFTTWLYLYLPMEGFSKMIVTITLSLALCFLIAQLFAHYIDDFAKSASNWLGKVITR